MEHPELFTFLTIFFLLRVPKSNAAQIYAYFLRMCDYLGVPIAQEKTFGPSKVIQFAGITLDSINQEAGLQKD